MEHADHCIVVCGHAIWAGGPQNGHDESEWVIEDWKKGETPTYMWHVKAGVQALSEDERSILVFSGGPTHKSTPLSEARSYANLAAANNYFNLLPPLPPSSSEQQHPLSPIPLHPRILVEERALDSYQNILFSIVHFWRNHPSSAWPRRLTIVSHSFKRTRLTDEHCTAIAFPLERVQFIGINPPGLVLVDGTLPQETVAVESWRANRHGMSPDLAAKRRRRNIYGVDQRLFLRDEERARSGVRTELVDDGKEEVLVDGESRPWS